VRFVAADSGTRVEIDPDGVMENTTKGLGQSAAPGLLYGVCHN
jgi:hypothetical protein